MRVTVGGIEHALRINGFLSPQNWLDANLVLQLNMRQKSLQNPPVVESVIELRVAQLPATESVFERLKAVVDEFAGTHPNFGEVAQFQATGSIGLGSSEVPAPTIEQFRYGYSRHCAESRIQASLDGIYLGTLQKPYIGGAALMQQALEVMKVFREKFPDAPLVRLGWRTINRIDLPNASIQDAGKLVESWRAMQDAGFELALPIAHLQGVKASGFPGLAGRVTTVLQADPSPDFLSLVVDVDGSSEAPADLGAELQRLRGWKNHAFFATLNEEAERWLN